MRALASSSSSDAEVEVKAASTSAWTEGLVEETSVENMDTWTFAGGYVGHFLGCAAFNAARVVRVTVLMFNLSLRPATVVELAPFMVATLNEREAAVLTAALA